METAIKRHVYSGADDLSAMQAALAAWIGDAGDRGYCHIGDIPHRIYNGLRNLPDAHELVGVWRAAGEVLAFAIVNPDLNGYDVFVSPAHRGGDLEREALEWGYTTARTWMDRDEKADTEVITDIFEGDSVRAALLLEMGFTPEDEPWMSLNERSLEDDLPEVTLPEGFSIRGAVGEEDAEQLAAVHSGAFGSDWTAEEYRDAVMRKPGYTPEYERVAVAPDGRFAAFALIWLDRHNRVGLFEPVGTHEDFQRMGLGRAILAEGMQFMRDQGMTRAQVANEIDEPAAAGLYTAMGFARKYAMIGYRRR